MAYVAEGAARRKAPGGTEAVVPAVAAAGVRRKIAPLVEIEFAHQDARRSAHAGWSAVDFPNNSLDDHDRVIEALNYPADWPDGLIAHGAYEVDGHLVVSDVWQSRQDFDRFVEQRLQRAMADALGDRANEPEIVERQLHHFSSQDHATR